MGIDTELQKNLSIAKSGRLMFAFAHKGSAGALVVNRKISGKDVAHAKEKAGGGTLFRGRCFGEDGQMIFEVAKEPPATLEAAIKRAISQEAGLSLKVVVRFAADAEAEGNDQESQEANDALPETPPPQTAPIPPAPPPPGSEDAFKARLKAVQAQLSAAGGPTPDQKMLLNQVFSAARNKDYAAALDALKEVDGSKKAKKEEPDTHESATFKRALADLRPRFDQAHVINADLMPQMGQILSLAKANHYADALEMLDKLEIDVDRTLASAPKPAANGDAFKARLKALLPKYNAAIKEDPALLAKLRPLMGQVLALSNASQFEQASVFLIQIEKALNVAKPADIAEAVLHRFTGLKAAIKAALSAGGPNVARIQALVGSVAGLLKNHDTAQADKLLDELEPLLKPATGAGTTDLGAEWKAKLAEWTPAIKAALTAKGPNAAAIAKLFAEATTLAKPGGDLAQALEKLTECHELATAGAGESVETVPEEEEEPDEETPAPTDRWAAARQKVEVKLAEEIKVVLATDDPAVAAAELELKVVLRQIKAPMETRQHALEMERYLLDDDVVADVCELAFDLKSPLLAVLADIKTQLPA